MPPSGQCVQCSVRRIRHAFFGFFISGCTCCKMLQLFSDIFQQFTQEYPLMTYTKFTIFISNDYWYLNKYFSYSEKWLQIMANYVSKTGCLIINGHTHNKILDTKFLRFWLATSEKIPSSFFFWLSKMFGRQKWAWRIGIQCYRVKYWTIWYILHGPLQYSVPQCFGFSVLHFWKCWAQYCCISTNGWILLSRKG